MSNGRTSMIFLSIVSFLSGCLNSHFRVSSQEVVYVLLDVTLALDSFLLTHFRVEFIKHKNVIAKCLVELT